MVHKKIEMRPSKVNERDCVHALKRISTIIILLTLLGPSHLNPPPSPPAGYLEFPSFSRFLLCAFRKRKCTQTAPVPRKAPSELRWQARGPLGRLPPTRPASAGLNQLRMLWFLFQREGGADVCDHLLCVPLTSLYDRIYLYKTVCTATRPGFLLCVRVVVPTFHF